MKQGIIAQGKCLFAKSYVTETELAELKEVVRMTDLGVMLMMDEKKSIAKNLLRRGMSISDIAEDTGLDEATIKELQAELELSAA